MTDCKGEERTTAEKGNKKIFLWQIRCWKNVSSGKNSATHQHEGKEKVESANIALSCSLLCPENSQLKCFWPALRDVIEVTIYLPLIVANASSDCLQKKTLKKNTKKTLKKYRKGFVFWVKVEFDVNRGTKIGNEDFPLRAEHSFFESKRHNVIWNALQRSCGKDTGCLSVTPWIAQNHRVMRNC